MLCPACKDKSLVMSERQGVEIDYCPGCRGIWLDRGELDKIIERSEGVGGGGQQSVAPQPMAQSMPPAHGGARKMDDSDYGYVYQDPTGHPQKNRKGMLRELFDF